MSLQPDLLERSGGTITAEVLVVEDDVGVARNVVRALRPVTERLDLVASVAAARVQVRMHAYTALVLDIRLPDGDGLDVARELRRGGSFVPIVVMSGAMDGDLALEILDLHALPLPKPVSGSALRNALARALASPTTPFAAVCAFAQAQHLSERETAVLLAAVRGLHPDAQAQVLGCTPSTLSTYWHRVIAKCGVHSQREVLAAIVRYYESRPAFMGRAGAHTPAWAPRAARGALEQPQRG